MRGRIGEGAVGRMLTSAGCTVDQVQAEAERLWGVVRSDGALAAELRDLGVEPADLSDACPFVASQHEEGFGVVETILIGAAGSVLGRVSEAALWRLWDSIMFPRISARLPVESDPDEGNPAA